jgi:Na+-translocating ferredoxin:NAD+ oxidoreductase RnfC subunit
VNGGAQRRLWQYRRREACSLWQQRKHQESREEHKRKNREARAIIADSKREAKRRWSERLLSEFRESNKIFWKVVNRKRKPQEKIEEVVKNENGEIIHGNEQVVER